MIAGTEQYRTVSKDASPVGRMREPDDYGSLRSRLAVLAVAALAPMMLLFAAEGYADYRAERARAGQRQMEVARSMAATVERELAGAVAGLQALALSPRLQVDDLPGFRKLALRFEATQPASSALLLLDQSGQQLINTHVPEGGQLRRRDRLAAAEAARDVFGLGRPHISNLFPRALNGKLIITADVPVFRDGRVIYDLSYVLPAARFGAIIAGQHLPAGTISAVFDRHGTIVARSPDPQHFTGGPAAPALLSALLSQPEGVVSGRSLEGTPLLTSFSRSEPSGWSVAIGVPDAVLSAPLRHSLRLLFGAGVLGLSISLGLAYALARRVLVPMRALARFAAQPLRPPPAAFGLQEVDAVADALRHSAAERQAAMDELRLLNEGLEARVRHEIGRREQALALLAQSQRMEALGQLAGGIAHDFNNVLQAVTGGLSLIERRATDPEAVRRLCVMAADAAGRGAAVTGRLLTFARRGELQAVAVDPQTLLESLREMLGPTLGAAICVAVDVPAGLPQLCADRAQLETVLVNLAVNARDAMPQGGTLALSAAAEQAGAAADQPPSLDPGAYLRLQLADSGIGMDAATLERAAEPFFTTKGPGQGTGLGLSMARGFAEQSGGGLCIRSAPGQGTVVSLWFPQAPADPAPLGTERDTLAASDAPGAFDMLMVDDDSMVCELLAQDMRDRGISVTTAHDGLSALALLDDGQPADLLVTDYAMPGMNGLALIGEARRRRPGLRALLLTGYAEAETGITVSGDRLTVLLRKPVSGHELARQAAELRQSAPLPA